MFPGEKLFPITASAVQLDKLGEIILLLRLAKGLAEAERNAIGRRAL